MEGTLGEVKLWAGYFIPENWVACEGQLLMIPDYTALYSLMGTVYGGDGRTTFGLPDLRARVIVGQGQSSVGTVYKAGEAGGQEYVGLTLEQMPTHQHKFMVSDKPAYYTSPQSTVLSAISSNLGEVVFYLPEDPAEEKILPLRPDVLQVTGNAQMHYNMMPYQVMTYIICVKGNYPPTD
ncbi:MAG TPA: tail fiber protein [Flavipsychrobacter sp.]